MPVGRKAHQAQLLATPPWRTRSVTRLGVSVLNVVATIDTPMSHHGAAWPEAKNSDVLRPALRASHTAGANDTASEAATMSQSSCVSATGYTPTMPSGAKVRHRPRVKSGKSTVRAREAFDCTLSSTTADSAAASYTFMSVGSPSRRHLMRR